MEGTAGADLADAFVVGLLDTLLEVVNGGGTFDFGHAEGNKIYLGIINNISK
jgi:hypothetical protein